LVRDRGITLRRVPFSPETGLLDLEGLDRLLTPRTRLVAIGAASNALGTINDVARIAQAAKSVGALVFVDAVHYTPHRLVDVTALGADFLACSAYKFYGPHVGMLYGRRGFIEGLDVPKLAPAPATAPERLETGTQNHEGIAGAGATVNWLASLVGLQGSRRERLAVLYRAAHERELDLFRELWDGLGAIPGVTRYGPPPGGPRTGTVSFVVREIPSRTVAERLATDGLFVSNGDFYASTVAERLGHARDGLVRVGLSLYSTRDEVRRLLEAVDTVSGKR
jgi:selenocysteine lyase/cysteine desulfurase